MYRLAPDIMETADRLIHNIDALYHIVEEEYSIGYFYCEKSHPQNAYATCQKVSGLLHYYSDHDFIITLYEPKTEDLTEAQLQMLVYHELLHIGEDGKLNSHTVQDFYSILKEYGLDWITNKKLKKIVGDKK